MTIVALRKELHHLIDAADEKRLTEIYEFVQGEPGNEQYTAQELAEFYGRLAKYESGEEPGYTMEETIEYIKANRKKR